MNSKPKTIGFLDNKLGIRGTSIALYDYAHYNEKLLNNKSIIITREVDPRVYKKFLDRFTIVYYKTISDLDTIVTQYSIDAMYIIKAGNNDKLVPNNCKSIIHCVFETIEPHGSYYCGISEWLNMRYNTNVPILHHMISLPDIHTNLREQLAIPNDAIVFGSYGGDDTIVPYVQDCIISISKNPIYSHIYFIFMNIPPFHPSTNTLKFIEGVSDMNVKRMFINTCDAMVYGRAVGETFGLAIGEFSTCDKPIIANKHPRDKFHIYTLEDNIILHEKYEELYDILTNYKNYKKDVSKNNYKLYTPEYVMGEFSNILNQLLD